MPRPRKSRNICHFPGRIAFAAADFPSESEPVILTVDEYETIRLIDREGLSQETCGVRMGIARTTVQTMYASARKKLAQMLVEGKPLRIAGGDYRICDGLHNCGQTHCYKQYYSKQYEKPCAAVRLAVLYTNENITYDFEQTQQIRIYDVRDGQVLASQNVDLKDNVQNQLAGVLTAMQTDVLICEKIAARERLVLETVGIRFLSGNFCDEDTAIAEMVYRM